jgi:hypothetical protein
LKGVDFKFNSLKEVKTGSRSSLIFQLTLDRLILFLMQICLLRVVTFIDLSAPCSADSLKIFKELSKIYLGQILLRRSILYHLIFSKSLLLLTGCQFMYYILRITEMFSVSPLILLSHQFRYDSQSLAFN